MMHCFLLIGQSNMAGRGLLADAEPLDTLDGRLNVLRNGRWIKLFRPVNPDRHTAGANLAESFAKAYALDNPDVQVGLIPCADGGTNIDQWQKGEILYDNAVFNAKLAMRTAHLAGILWHQGESDCADEAYPVYLEKLTKMVLDLRQDLQAPHVPLVVGGLGDFLKDFTRADLSNYVHVNRALQDYALQTPHTAFASAQGLGANPDNLHFSSGALQAFGLRYYKAFASIEDKTATVDRNKQSQEAMRSMELL